MAVLVYKGPSVTVNTIADRNAILRKIDNMVVTVKDAIADPEAGPGYATYRYNASLGIWILEAEAPGNEVITLTGDATGSGVYTGVGATIEVTVKDDSHNHIISNIDGLSTALDNKVDKITGKGLSAEDYTSEEKNKLGTIESGAQVNVPTDISIGGTGNTRTILSSTGGGAAIPLASSTTAGFMSISDKLKLGGIESGATKNATDLEIRNRSTHHGTQAISTIDGLQDALDAQSSGLETHKHTLADITDSGNLAGIDTNGSPTNYLNGSGAWSTPPDTKYSEITTVEIDAGTSATLRTITGRRIKYALDKKADVDHTHSVSDITGLIDALPPGPEGPQGPAGIIPIYNSAGLVDQGSAKAWVGTVVSDDQGVFSVDWSSAGFSQVFHVDVSAYSGVTAPEDHPQAVIGGFDENGGTGYTIRGRTIVAVLVGGAPTQRTAPNTTVTVFVWGI